MPEKGLQFQKFHCPRSYLKQYKTKQTCASSFILNVYTEGELQESNSIRKIGISDFSTKPTNFYNLDMIISVGYRVKSLRSTQFRQWATEKLYS